MKRNGEAGRETNMNYFWVASRSRATREAPHPDVSLVVTVAGINHLEDPFQIVRRRHCFQLHPFFRDVNFPSVMIFWRTCTPETPVLLKPLTPDFSETRSSSNSNSSSIRVLVSPQIFTRSPRAVLLTPDS